ncbi:hypothetical protein [Arthrobacter pigmenti]
MGYYVRRRHRSRVTTARKWQYAGLIALALITFVVVGLLLLN